MKLTTIISILATISIFIAYGASYDSYEADYYEEEAYYPEFAENEMANLEAFGNSPYAKKTGGLKATAVHATQVGKRYSADNEVPMRPLIDPKTGQATAYAPIPKSWKIGKIWEAPGGTKVEMRTGGTKSSQERPLRSIDQLIQQYLLPEIKRSGAQVDNIIDLPGIAQNNEKNQSLYWQAMPTKMTFAVKGIEMTDLNTGEKGLLIVNFMIGQSQYGSYNTNYSCILSAQANRYEKDKRTLIYALENMQMDRQAVAMHNQREQQKSQVSWASHNQRMYQKKANFDSWQKTQQTYSEISDISHEGWKNRNAINNAGQQKTINGIWEQETSVNPSTGQQMNTSIHYKYNYVNQNGQVFGSNNPNYNPALDPNMNHMQWQKVQGSGGNY